MIVCLCLDGDLITISDTSDLNLAKQRHRLLKITILSKLYNIICSLKVTIITYLSALLVNIVVFYQNVKVFYHFNVLTFEGLNALFLKTSRIYPHFKLGSLCTHHLSNVCSTVANLSDF